MWCFQRHHALASPEQCYAVTWTEWCHSVSAVLFHVSPDSATDSTPVLTEGYSSFFLLALKREVPNLTASEEFHPGTQLMTSLIKFLIFSRSILITFSLSFFFFFNPQPHWADPGSPGCLSRVCTKQLDLRSLAATYWCSDLCGLLCGSFDCSQWARRAICLVLWFWAERNCFLMVRQCEDLLSREA